MPYLSDTKPIESRGSPLLVREFHCRVQLQSPNGEFCGYIF